MKKLSIVWMLLVSIPTTLIAQTSLELGGTDPSGAQNLRMTYYKDLKMGNTFKLEIYGTRQLPPSVHIDSLVGMMTAKLYAIKDSLPDEATGRTLRIDIYNSTTNEINIRSTKASDKSFVEHNGDRSMLKTIQDSIILNLHTSNDPLSKTKTFYRLSFFLNDLFDIEKYSQVDLSIQIENAEPDNSSLWNQHKNGSLYLKSDPALVLFKSYDPTLNTRNMVVNISVSLQNYSKTIVPSFGLGVGFQKEHNYKVTSYWLLAEPHFTFFKNEKGTRKTHVSTFAVLRYRQYSINNSSTSFLQGIYKNFSVGYLLNDKGGLYPPNTFRIGFTEIYLGRQSLRLEPAMYFDHLFKNALPSLRISKSF